MKKIETLRIDVLKEVLNLIDIKEETFIINGEKIFIYGGELHYFRVPKKEWEDRIKKIKEEMLRFYNDKMEFKSEKGMFNVMVGSNSRDLQVLSFELK
jgi:uncharacterized radical SAM superfamily protein